MSYHDPRHGTRTRYAKGCRCPECKEAKYKASKREREARALRIPENIEHSYSTYTNWKCRCDICRKANALHQKEYRNAMASAD